MFNLVDVVFRYQETKPIEPKDANEVARALARIYKWRSLRWLKPLKLVSDREFMEPIFSF